MTPQPLNIKELEIYATGYLLATHDHIIRTTENSSEIMAKLSAIMEDIEGIKIVGVLGKCMIDRKILDISVTIHHALKALKRISDEENISKWR